jgi:hypothetical protein
MSKAQLRHLLNEYFSERELREICFDLDVPYDELGGRGKGENVMELIGYLERRDRLAELLGLGQQLRPNISWPTADAVSLPEDTSLKIDAPSRTDPLQNPFTYGNPISDPGRFFGRRREIEQVFSRLTNPEHESSSLVGSRRIGKTSLLKHISHPDVRRRFGLDSQRYIFLYIDLQMLDKSTTPVRLWKRLLAKMAPHCQDAEVKQLIKELREAEQIDNFALADLFDAIDAAGQHLVLLLDEFENVTKNENFDVGFFYGLRSLAIQYNLSLVTSSSQELIELTHSEAIRSSPFFNIFANINVGLFSEEESRQLIDAYLAKTSIQFSPASVDTILDVAGTYPFFLQVAGHFLFRAYQKGLGTAEQVEYLLSRFDPEAAPHFDHYWQLANAHEHIVLITLALLSLNDQQPPADSGLPAIKNLYVRAEQTLPGLVRHGLVTSRQGHYALFSTSFARWIVGQIGNPADDQQGIATWTEINVKRIELLPKPTRDRLASLLPIIADRYRNLIVSWLASSNEPNRVTDLLELALA